jgi:hypothetical protein
MKETPRRRSTNGMHTGGTFRATLEDALAGNWSAVIIKPDTAPANDLFSWGRNEAKSALRVASCLSVPIENGLMHPLQVAEPSLVSVLAYFVRNRRAHARPHYPGR